MVNGMWFVYSLSCPVTGDTRYIGAGKNPAQRLKMHCGPHAAMLVRAWVSGLGGRPPMLTELSCHRTRQAALEREAELIRELAASGARLLNVEGHPNSAERRHRHRPATTSVPRPPPIENHLLRGVVESVIRTSVRGHLSATRTSVRSPVQRSGRNYAKPR